MIAIGLLVFLLVFLFNPTFGILFLGLIVYGAYSFNLPNQS